MMSPLPSLGKPYSMIQHDEKQKEHSAVPSSLSTDSMSFHASYGFQGASPSRYGDMNKCSSF